MVHLDFNLDYFELKLEKPYLDLVLENRFQVEDDYYLLKESRMQVVQIKIVIFSKKIEEKSIILDVKTLKVEVKDL